jgi:hypothetical protein
MPLPFVAVIGQPESGRPSLAAVGRPLAVSVNRGNSLPGGLLRATAVFWVLRYRFLLRIHGSQNPVAPLRTSHPSGSRRGVSSS